jgi:hypothetical protein
MAEGPELEGSQLEDCELEVVRLAVTSDANNSIKRTFLACMIIRAAARPRAPASTGMGRRRTVTVIAVAVSVFGVAHWWHLIMSVLSHIPR